MVQRGGLGLRDSLLIKMATLKHWLQLALFVTFALGAAWGQNECAGLGDPVPAFSFRDSAGVLHANLCRNAGTGMYSWPNLNFSGFGSLNVSGNATAGSFDGVFQAEGQSGTDIGARINAAESKCSGSPCTIKLTTPGPSTCPVTGSASNINGFTVPCWKYSTDIFFFIPATLECAPGVFLQYTGTGNAVKLGPDGLTQATANMTPYTVKNCGFVGDSAGSNFANGIYCNNFVLNCNVVGNTFYNFGSSTAFAIFTQANNWFLTINYNWFVDLDLNPRNKIRVRGKSVGGVSDIGQSQLFMRGNVLTAPNMPCCTTAANTGIGVWFTGSDTHIVHNKIEGYGPNIRIASAVRSADISNNFLDDISNVCNIEYGDPVGGDSPSSFAVGVVIDSNSTLGVHDTDLGATANAICPTGTDGGGSANTTTGMQTWTVDRNQFGGLPTTSAAIVQNNNVSQFGNVARDNIGFTLLHTTGSNILPWTTWMAGQYWNSIDDAANGNYLALREGATVDGFKGISANGFSGTLHGLCDWNSVGTFRCLSGTGLFNAITGDSNGNVTISSTGKSSFRQSARVAGCTTGAAAGNSCGTDITVTWTTTMTDANYTVTCTGNNPTNVPSAPFVVSGTQLAATVHINYFAITAAAASYATVECTAFHD